MSNIDIHEGGRQAIEAVLRAADRYVTASEAHEARDWDTFESEGLAAVSVEYERLKEAVEMARARRMLPVLRRTSARHGGSDG